MKIKKDIKNNKIKLIKNKYLFLLFSPIIIIPIKNSLAACTTISYDNAPNTSSQYIQNGFTNCTGNTTANIITGASVYGTNFFQTQKISAQTSQILRWQHDIVPLNRKSNLEINVNAGAVVEGDNATKGLLLVHTGYYRDNGDGAVPTINKKYTPENRATIKIENNGSVINRTTSQNTDVITSSAASIESNDGPADQGGFKSEVQHPGFQ